MRADDLNKGVARVLGPSGAIGTAFFVAPRLLVTCAHVLRDLWKRGPLRDRRFQLETVHPARTILHARVAQWREEDQEDVAFLELVGPPLDGVQVLPLGPSVDSDDHYYSAFGFPAQKNDEGMPGVGMIGGLTTRGGHPVRLLAYSDQITWGFSGGPIFDRQSRRVVGVAVSIIEPDRAGRGARTAFMIPSETLLRLRPDLSLRPECPYLGDAPFKQEHRQLFFGRTEVVEKVAAAVRHGERLILLTGPSSSGKTSILRAGVLPLLREAPEPCRVEELDLRDGPDARIPERLLGAAARLDAGRDAGGRALLVVDHLEALFGDTPPPAEVARLFGQPDAPGITLLCAADEASLHALPEPVAKLFEKASRVPVPRVKRHDIAEAIRRPAEAVGLHFEERNIPEQLASDCLERFGAASDTAPPHALMIAGVVARRMWQRASDGVLKLPHDHDGDLVAWAEEALERALSKPDGTRPFQEDWRHAEGVLGELIEVGDVVASPRPRRRKALPAEHTAFADRLRTARILVASPEADGEVRFELCCPDPAFVARWPRLRLRVETLRSQAAEQRAVDQAEQARLDVAREKAIARGRWRLLLAGWGMFAFAVVAAAVFLHLKNRSDQLSALDSARVHHSDGHAAWAARSLLSVDSEDPAYARELVDLGLQVLRSGTPSLLEHEEPIIGVSLDASGTTLATLGISQRVWIWSSPALRGAVGPIGTLLETKGIGAVRFGADGALWLLVASPATDQHPVQRWHLARHPQSGVATWQGRGLGPPGVSMRNLWVLSDGAAVAEEAASELEGSPEIRLHDVSPGSAAGDPKFRCASTKPTFFGPLQRVDVSGKLVVVACRDALHHVEWPSAKQVSLAYFGRGVRGVEGLASTGGPAEVEVPVRGVAGGDPDGRSLLVTDDAVYALDPPLHGDSMVAGRIVEGGVQGAFTGAGSPFRTILVAADNTVVLHWNDPAREAHTVSVANVGVATVRQAEAGLIGLGEDGRVWLIDPSARFHTLSLPRIETALGAGTLRAVDAHQLAVSGDGRSFAAARGERVVRWWRSDPNTDSGLLTQDVQSVRVSAPGHAPLVHVTARSDGGVDLLATTDEGSVRRWTVPKSGVVGPGSDVVSPLGERVRSFGAAASGAVWATGPSGGYRLHGPALAEPRVGPALAVAAHPTKHCLVEVRDDGALLCGAFGGESAPCTGSGDAGPYLPGDLPELAFSPAGDHLLAIRRKSGQVDIYATGETCDLSGRSSGSLLAGLTDEERARLLPIDAAALSAGGRAVAAVLHQKEAVLWMRSERNEASATLHRVGQGPEDWSLAFSRDGRWLAVASRIRVPVTSARSDADQASIGSTITLWALPHLARAAFSLGTDCDVEAVDIDVARPRGEPVVAAGCTDGKALIWNLDWNVVRGRLKRAVGPELLPNPIAEAR